jgi:hypothetical protein
MHSPDIEDQQNGTTPMRPNPHSATPRRAAHTPRPELPLHRLNRLPARLPPEVAVVWWWTTSRLHPAREDRDRGDILQTVIITAALAAAAIVIVALIVAKARTAANHIKTQ